MKTDLFDFETGTGIPSIDQVQTDRVISDVNANHRRFIQEQQAQARTEVLSPIAPLGLEGILETLQHGAQG